jgi:hypothetical protein
MLPDHAITLDSSYFSAVICNHPFAGANRNGLIRGVVNADEINTTEGTVIGRLRFRLVNNSIDRDG